MERDLPALEAALRARGLDPAKLALGATRLTEALRGVEEAARRSAEVEQQARTARRAVDAIAGRSFDLTARITCDAADEGVLYATGTVNSSTASRTA